MKIQLKYIEVKPSKILLFSLSETAHKQFTFANTAVQAAKFPKAVNGGSHNYTRGGEGCAPH